MSAKKEKKGGFLFTENSIILIVLAGLITLSLVGSSIYADAKIKKKTGVATIKKENDEKKVLGFTPTPTPTKTSLINCNVHANCGGGTRQMTQSECSDSICCQVGDQWLVYTSRSKCNEDQAKYEASNRIMPPTGARQNGSTVPIYPPCTLYSKTYTHLTPDECKKEKEIEKSIKHVAPSNIPTISPTPWSTYTPNPTSNTPSSEQIAKCKTAVRAKFDDLVLNCNTLQGSAVDVCRRAYGDQIGSYLNTCEQTGSIPNIYIPMVTQQPTPEITVPIGYH